MTDYLYKFTDEVTAQTVLADYYDSEYGWKTADTSYCLDPVGILVDTDNTDPENPISTPLEGWHLNLRTFDNRPDPAPEYRVFPGTQRRVWL